MNDGPIPQVEVEKNLKSKPKFWHWFEQVCKSNPKGRPYTKDGQFVPDPTPIAPPIGYVQEPSMFDRVRDMIRKDASIRAQQEGFESFEEADDFDVEEDYVPFSPYELILEQAQPDGPVVNGEGPPPEDSSSDASKSERKPRAPSRSEPAMEDPEDPPAPAGKQKPSK